VTYNDIARDFDIHAGEATDGQWHFANGQPRTTGCQLETVAFDEFGSQNTEHGFLRATVEIGRYSWYGPVENYDNLPLVSLFISFVDRTGTTQRMPHVVPIHYLQRVQQSGDDVSAINQDWSVLLPDVPFAGVIKDIKVQVCSISGRSIIDLRKVELRMSDG
jgi:hypothetical protein